MPARAKGFGFPARLRLTEARQFDHVFAEPHRSTDAIFAVAARHNDITHPRLGLAVSRRAGNAVKRHMLKRRIRESFRLHQHSLPATDIVVVARNGAGRRCSADIDASLAGHWRRITRKCAASS